MDLTEQYRALHRRGKFPGTSTKHYVDQIGYLVRAHGASRLLDYGSGKGEQYRQPRAYQEHWGVPTPILYDPAVPGLDNWETVARLAPYCGVICVDVLEHLEELVAVSTLAALPALVRPGGFVFVAVHTGPARKRLPDGRNAHLTQRPAEWWQTRADMVGRMSPGCTVHLVARGPEVE